MDQERFRILLGLGELDRDVSRLIIFCSHGWANMLVEINHDEYTDEFRTSFK